MLKKVGSRLSGLDADGWRTILASRAFVTTTLDLRKTLAQLIKKLCVEELKSASSSKPFVACRLIPLDKKPGLRPIGVGEKLRGIASKAAMMLSKNDIKHAPGIVLLSVGQDAGVKAIVLAMDDIFFKENSKAALLIDAENAFYSINRKVMLHNIKFLCPLISTNICNC